MKSRTTRTMRYFNALKKEFDSVDDNTIDELREEIENQKIRHFDFATFSKSGEFYTCDLPSIKFTKQDENYLVSQEEYAYDSFRGYLAYPLKNGKYWIVSFEE
ncbi:hypothetical protein [Campylobacter gastrosuis]|uniref:Uncharacterized protein n=1 Tax=Campylobacter gastrosuis TaxID=2974576 RepID=A0ABT7HQ04_9BACT|nr:hypothetical protein [Campylobacter gastrosuis]MDL0088508.1 hypothetical protein [Campylobacter gastrosuis]